MKKALIWGGSLKSTQLWLLDWLVDLFLGFVCFDIHKPLRNHIKCHTIRPQIDENWNYLIIAAIKTNDTTTHSKDLSTFRSDFGRVSFQLLFAVVFETLHSSFRVFIENQENLNRTQITHKKGLHYAARDCLLRCCVRWCCTRFQYKLRIRKVTNWKIIYNTRPQPGACGFTMILFHAINAPRLRYARTFKCRTLYTSSTFLIP